MSLQNVYGPSHKQKRKFDPILRGRKPDFAVLTSGQSKVPLLVAEVKPATHRVNRGPWSDLAKLGNELKDMVDSIIDVHSTQMGGILIEGFRCDPFVMDRKFNNIYRMIQLGRFYLLQDRHNFDTIIIQSAEHRVMSYRNLLMREGAPPPKTKMT
ncbi:hypothetical protein G9A89_005011 [Geosiphon pyriformis]|nr:hypothetical protein G9A89_005011 [Geosiphon pyriformis]